MITHYHNRNQNIILLYKLWSADKWRTYKKESGYFSVRRVSTNFCVPYSRDRSKYLITNRYIISTADLTTTIIQI